MKKIVATLVLGVVLLASTNTTFAANNISKMATTKGGQHVAECAQKMDQGVSQCVQMSECMSMDL